MSAAEQRRGADDAAAAVPAQNCSKHAAAHTQNSDHNLISEQIHMPGVVRKCRSMQHEEHLLKDIPVTLCACSAVAAQRDADCSAAHTQQPISPPS
jgi:hypothetical protein